MPLAIPAKADQDELERYKQRVYVEAKKMAKRHGLCDVVDKTLEALDVPPYVPEMRAVDVEVTFKGTMSVKVDVNQMAGMTPEDEKKYLENLVKDKPVKNLTVKVKDAKFGEDFSVKNIPEGYVALFASNEGRVRHIFDGAVAQARSGEASSSYSLCGSNIGWYNYVSHLVEESPRDEGRICARCTAKAENL